MATLNVGSALFIFLTRVSGIVWAKRPADQLGSKQYTGFRQAPFKLHLRRLLFNEEFYRTRKQIADGTSQFKKHSVNVRASHVRCSSKGKQIALLTYIVFCNCCCSSCCRHCFFPAVGVKLEKTLARGTLTAEGDRWSGWSRRWTQGFPLHASTS